MRNLQIQQEILKVCTDYRFTVGAPKIRLVLRRREYGSINISLGRVYRILNNMDLPRYNRKKCYKAFGSPQNGIFHNKLEQKFKQPTPNSVWVGDFTYIPAPSGFYYFAVILDLFSRKVIGYNVSTNHTCDLVVNAFKQALGSRKAPTMFHSDRGSEYTSYAFSDLLDRLHVNASFSKKGYPYDNAVAESFFKHFKQRWCKSHRYSNITECRLSIFEYINLYNNKIPHSAANNLPPSEYEALYNNDTLIGEPFNKSFPSPRG